MIKAEKQPAPPDPYEVALLKRFGHEYTGAVNSTVAAVVNRSRQLAPVAKLCIDLDRLPLFGPDHALRIMHLVRLSTHQVAQGLAKYSQIFNFYPDTDDNSGDKLEERASGTAIETSLDKRALAQARRMPGFFSSLLKRVGALSDLGENNFLGADVEALDLLIQLSAGAARVLPKAVEEARSISSVHRGNEERFGRLAQMLDATIAAYRTARVDADRNTPIVEEQITQLTEMMNGLKQNPTDIDLQLVRSDVAALARLVTQTLEMQGRVVELPTLAVTRFNNLGQTMSALDTSRMAETVARETIFALLTMISGPFYAVNQILQLAFAQVSFMNDDTFRRLVGANKGLTTGLLYKRMRQMPQLVTKTMTSPPGEQAGGVIDVAHVNTEDLF